MNTIKNLNKSLFVLLFLFITTIKAQANISLEIKQFLNYADKKLDGECLLKTLKMGIEDKTTTNQSFEIDVLFD